MEARVCVCGCGKELRDEDGEPVFNKYFFSSACRSLDKAVRRKLAKDKVARKALKKELRGLKKLSRPVWVIVRGRRIGLATARGALLLAQRYPEILEQIEIEPVKAKRRRK